MRWFGANPERKRHPRRCIGLLALLRFRDCGGETRRQRRPTWRAGLLAVTLFNGCSGEPSEEPARDSAQSAVVAGMAPPLTDGLTRQPGFSTQSAVNEGMAPDPSTVAYVGSQVCGQCHQKQHQAWLGSHHQRAMLPATGETVAGDFTGAKLLAPAGTVAGDFTDAKLPATAEAADRDASVDAIGDPAAGPLVPPPEAEDRDASVVAQAPEAHGVRMLAEFSQADGRFLIGVHGPDGDWGRFEVRYTFGVAPLQQYLLALPGGRLQASRPAWNTLEGRWFDLRAGETIDHRDALHWTAPAYNWNFMCADCHSTAVRKGYDPASQTYRSEFAEVSVGCEACHGPGAAHARWTQGAAQPRARPAQPSLGTEDAAGPNSATGGTASARTRPKLAALADQQAQINACAPCHSRRSQLAEGFTPQRSYFDHYSPALLEEGLYHADGQILDEVYVYGSFLQSRMHEAGVTCGHCHEPHSAQLRTLGNALCTGCHNEAGRPDFPTLPLGRYDHPDHHLHAEDSAGSQCVNCHMPATTYMLVDDRRDHSFRKPRPDLNSSTGAPDACTRCHEDRDAHWAALTLATAFGGKDAAQPSRNQDAEQPRLQAQLVFATAASDQALQKALSGAQPHFGPVFAAARATLPTAETSLANIATNAQQPAMVRATALSLMAAYDRGISSLALRQGLRDAHPLVRIGALRGAARWDPMRRWREANRLLRDEFLAVRTEAAPLLAPALGHLTGAARNRLQTGIGEYLEVQAYNADRPEAHTNIGAIHLAVGAPDRAQAAFRKALALEPNWVPALVNLADLHRAAGRDAQAGPLLLQAHQIAPDAPAVLLARSLWLVRQHRQGEALPLLAEAARLAPTQTRYIFTYAIALHSAGQPGKALDLLDATLEQRPSDRQLLQTALSIAHEANLKRKALEYQRRLAG